MAQSKEEEEKKSAMVTKQKWRTVSSRLPIWRPAINNTGKYPNPIRDAYRVFHSKIEPGDRVSPMAIGIRLKTKVGEPVKGNGETLILQEREVGLTGKGAIPFSGSRRRRTPLAERQLPSRKDNLPSSKGTRRVKKGIRGGVGKLGELLP